MCIDLAKRSDVVIICDDFQVSVFHLKSCDYPLLSELVGGTLNLPFFIRACLNQSLALQVRGKGNTTGCLVNEEQNGEF